MKKLFVLPICVALFMLICGITVFAAGYSSAWYQDNGVWKVKGPDGQTLKNCWFCDDAVFENGKNVWYLLDANGNMISQPLVKDARGNYYSLETAHDGHYGSLRYLSGTYDDIKMLFSQKHDGTFGALTNENAIKALTDEYGVTDINIDSNNCVYSSSWLGVSAAPSATAQSTTGPSGVSDVVVADNASRMITYTYGNKKLGTQSGNTRYFTVQKYDVEDFLYWSDNGMGEYQPGDMYVFEGNRTGAYLNAVTLY